MITKFEKYNESIKSLLVGPTKEEVLDNLGITIPDTPQEYIIDLIDKSRKETINHNTYWYINNIKVFHFNTSGRILFCSRIIVWTILSDVFGLSYNEITSVIKEIIEEKYNLGIESITKSVS